MQIYISNLTNKTTVEDIRNMFAEFDIVGVSNVRAIMDIGTRLPKSYAIIDIEGDANGALAISKMNNKVLCGNAIAVTKAG